MIQYIDESMRLLRSIDSALKRIAKLLEEQNERRELRRGSGADSGASD